MRTKHILKLLMGSVILPGYLYGQDLTKLWQKNLIRTPTSYSLDSEGNVFLGFGNGMLQKFSTDGTETKMFSIPNQSSITFVEAQNNRKVFLFYRDIQQINILDRFTTVPKRYDVLAFGITYAESACISPDGSFWFAENNPQRLKKIDPLRNLIIHEVQHNLGDSIRLMRTFGNLLLIGDENGLQILDQFGNLNGTIELKGISYIQILNNQIYLTNPKGLLKVDPFKAEIIEEVSHEVFTDRKAIMKLNTRFVVIDAKEITYYSFTNQKN